MAEPFLIQTAHSVRVQRTAQLTQFRGQDYQRFMFDLLTKLGGR